MLSDRDYMRDDDHFYPGGGRRMRRQSPPMSMVKRLIIANITILVLEAFDPNLLNLFALSWPQLSAGYFWTPLTHMFTHAGFWHLFGNMFGLYIFGPPVERVLGSRRFLTLYLFCGFIGAGLWLLFNFNSTIPVVGASGAVFGIMGAAAVLFPNQKMIVFPLFMTMKLKTLVICYAIFEAIQELQVSITSDGRTGGIAHIAHLGGLGAGMLLIRYATGQRRSRPSSWFRTLLSRWKRTRIAARLKHHPKPDGGETDDELFSREIDPILDKIGRLGPTSLTEKEKQILDRARRRFHNP